MIGESSLSPNEQKDFISAFAQADDVALQPIVDLCSEDGVWIKRLYENYKAKQSAHTTGDMRAWKEIFKDKEQLIGDIEK